MTLTAPPSGPPPAVSAPLSGAPLGPLSDRVVKLAAAAAEAAQVRALTTHPDVIALRVERVRAQVDVLLWAGIVLALGFTMVNVQSFAAAGSPAFTPGWWVAWLLDPMVSVVLLAVLRAEQVTARYQVRLPPWARRTKWLTFAATYVMNTWTSWGLADRPLSWSGVVLHSVPPLVVFAAAETGPGLRDRLTEAVHRALAEHTPGGSTAGATPVATIAASAGAGGAAHQHGHEPVHEDERARAPVHEPLVNGPATGPGGAATPARQRAPRAPGKTTGPAPRPRLGDYLTTARAALDTARAAGGTVEPTPTWCRAVTGCSAGTSVKLAAALRAALRTPDPSPSPPTVRQEAS